MKVSEKEVDYVAELANLELTIEERTRMVKDLNSILGYIDTLSELDTVGVAPMTQVTVGAGTEPGTNPYVYSQRPDQQRASLPHDAAMQNAPDRNADFFKVPKVIER
jgi:aspartyl-tRNA(Asn)/glutamyl-tRNA(Gln) amidotransferase subunit C